jgi:hypothetical protein
MARGRGEVEPNGYGSTVSGAGSRQLTIHGLCALSEPLHGPRARTTGGLRGHPFVVAAWFLEHYGGPL